MTATHIRPDGPPARDATTGRLVKFPALCGAELFGLNNVEATFAANRFTGVLCHDCLVAANLVGQLTLDLEVAR